MGDGQRFRSTPSPGRGLIVGEHEAWRAEARHLRKYLEKKDERIKVLEGKNEMLSLYAAELEALVSINARWAAWKSASVATGQ